MSTSTVQGSKRRVYIIRVEDSSYLSLHVNDDDKKTYLQFGNPLPAKKEDAQFDFITVAGQENQIRIQSVAINKYWRLERNNNWILVDDDLAHTNDSLFTLKHKPSTNEKVFYCVGNDKYCKAYSIGSVQDCLNARATTVDDGVAVDVIDV
ncbi:hypothetical protein G4B88_027833 [Cannabis sativa]|uniref:Agglutinin domain-containing protein n=1 Tax=Cannabis sativa TaxID=3483 RepID=A0A7J6DJT9_CANSA|nr:hypothetical protein G4B88_027802 [Cannabis sativa]KAF4346105.1 hypothetical protein G4B88_027833 [Cannabis sativa]